MIIKPLTDYELISGAIYQCKSTGRGFMCLLWLKPNGTTVIEHGHGFLHGGTDIVKIIRDTGTHTLVPSGDMAMLDHFIKIRTSSSTHLVWRK